VIWRVLLVVALVPVATASAATDLSRRPIPEDKRWRSLVLDQHGGVVYPARVEVVGAGVDNPDGLRAEGGGATTISGGARLVLDLGINTGGYVEVGVTKSDGTTIHLGYSEARRFLTPAGDTGIPIKLGIPLVTDPSLGNDDEPNGRQDDITAAGAWRSPGIRGAQRWIALQLQGAGSVSIDYVRVRETHLLAKTSDYTGRFYSSDGQLNRAWYASAYTFALDAFEDLRPGHERGNVVVTDGAKRDRLVWLGDLALENLLGGYALRQAPRIIRDSLQLFSCQQATDGLLPQSSQIDVVCPDVAPAPAASAGSVLLPEYTASWVIGLQGYHQLTGDDDFARRMLPVAQRAMAAFGRNANGLYATPLVAINWHPFDVAVGEDTHTNATIVRALFALAALERRVGSQERANDAVRRATALRDAIVARLWDAKEGAFLLNSLDPQRNHTQDAQVEAVLGDVITGARARGALRFLSSRLRTTYGTRNGERDADPFMSNYISPFISSTELLARLHVGDTAGALDLMRRLWGHMVDTDPHTTVWEKLTFDGEPAGYAPNQIGTDIVPPNSVLGRGLSSLAHGWSGGPVPALSGYVLGIRPVTPGYATWIVEPQPGDLRFAQGQAPTPRGALVSRWRRGARSFVLTVSAPRGTRGTVVVPQLGRARTIAMDGKVVWRRDRHVGRIRARRDGDAVRFSGLAGRHTFAWRAV
jgi:alpha-L-rhamnosidase